MLHNFIYSLKTLFRSKDLIFWTFAFPILLGTFFNMAFSNIENSEKLDIIDIAIVDNQEFKNNETYKEVFKELSSKENDDRLFNTKYVSESKAKKLLDDNKITGYLKLDNNKPKITITSNGINETVFNQVVEEIVQTSKIIENLSKTEITSQLKNGNTLIDYEQIYTNIIDKVNNQETSLNDISENNLSYTLIEFYTLIAMACLYGGMLGMSTINQNLANMSNNGKRVSVSPISKGKLILSSVLASYLVQLLGIALLFIYTIFVLKVDYGNNLALIIPLAMAGSLAGLTLGIAVSTILKTNENVKTGIILAITMVGSFLSGMMGITLKYVIDTNIPIINKINPASMITDGFYALYYYDTLDRYLINIISLLVFSIIMILLSYTSLRRQRYDSI